MTASTQLIEEQLKLERDQINLGLKYLTDNTMKLEDQSYASASVYGIASIDSLLPSLVKYIENPHNRIHAGHTGVAFKDIHQYLDGLEPLAAAAIACKVTFDKVFSFKEGSNYATNVCDSIGHAIEDECRLHPEMPHEACNMYEVKLKIKVLFKMNKF